MSARRPRLVLTCGEPAGIGPDLAVMLAAATSPVPAGYDLTILADEALLAQRAHSLGLPPPGGNGVRVEHVPLPVPASPGRLDARNACWVLRLLDHAIEGCRQRRFDAIVTAPVQKSIINDAGIPFTGHTEYLAERCGGMHPVMLLAGGGLRVALATTHLPVAEVSRHLTPALLDKTIGILDHDLRGHWGFTHPRIAVCGLNPHAGEGGHLGREEIDVIAPSIARARQAGIEASGPWPADTLFTPRQLANFDVVLAMFHDQGLPVLKHAAFGEAVNVTLGLPLLRTSVDHGTALDLAGTGRADVGSLAAAVRLAAELASRRPAA